MKIRRSTSMFYVGASVGCHDGPPRVSRLMNFREKIEFRCPWMMGVLGNPLLFCIYQPSFKHRVHTLFYLQSSVEKLGPWKASDRIRTHLIVGRLL